MRAMVMTAHGPPEVLKIQDMPEPICGDLDLLVEVHATAINPVDTKIRKAPYSASPLKPPIIQGYDVAGIVRGVGKAVEHFKIGDAVFASPSLARHGANAERVCVDCRTAARKPEKLSFEEAAALPLVSLTAWESLHKRAAMHHGETVLIHAGAGGVGHVAIQLARINGCRVLTTASRPASIELCRQLGADVVIDHSESDFVEQVKEHTKGQLCPVVFDTVGGAVFDKSLECVGLNGRLVTIVPNQSDKIVPALFRKNATLHCEFMGVPTVFGINPDTQSQTLRTIAELVDAGKLKPFVSKVIPLEDLAEGHRMQESQRTIGKIVVKVR